MCLIRKWFSSLQVVVLSLRFKIENYLATLSELGQLFPYIKWIPVSSRGSILFSTSWGVLQQLKPPLFLIFPVEPSEVQICGQIGYSMSAHTSCKVLIPPAPFGCWAIATAVLYLSQPVPNLTVGDRMQEGGSCVDIPNSFCSSEHVTAHSRCDAMHGNTCKPLCSCGSSLCGISSQPQKCWTRKPSKNCLGSLEVFWYSFWVELLALEKKCI